jgi:hypothetical protein
MIQMARLIQDMILTTLTCKHPPTRLYSWYAYNGETNKNDILVVCCCDCGTVLTGGV